MSFIVELWESIFTPGTTPSLIKATHASFVLLILSLSWSLYVSRSIHFFNLLVIATLLYCAVIWFIYELKNVKLNETTEKNVEEKKESMNQASGSSSTINKDKKLTKRKA